MTLRQKTRAFVLNRKNKGEANRVITFYTEDFGKISVFAKGIRKINSKLKENVENLGLLHIEFIETSKRRTLVDTAVLLSFSKSKKEIERFRSSEKIREDTNNLIKEEEKDKGVWNLLEETLIENENAKNYILLPYYFFFNLASLLGYKPELEKCCLCQRKINQEESFFLPGKGLVDKKCSKNSIVILPQTVKLLRFFLEKKAKEIAMIKTENIAISPLLNISEKSSGVFSENM
ncbi:MAG: DNA repair protein RecO [Candidatus Pacebacteria bacterium]|nr:DNA repair protein RecO [Candidatus Paceibacterota bacterium]MDD4467159.1 DNA repair protein RecO [Candidatus Paceibacterota bacterium]